MVNTPLLATATTTESTAKPTNTTVRPRMKSADESIATQQLQDRVFTALMNHQLLLRYAIANDLVSPMLYSSEKLRMSG